MAQHGSTETPRWQDVINFLLGIWLFVSPWVVGYAGAGTIATIAWALGIIVAILALLAILASQWWEEWLNAAIGLWILVSAWVLHVSANPKVLWNNLIVGALLVILSLWSLLIEHHSGEVASHR
jgi:hypothetical protein